MIERRVNTRRLILLLLGMGWLTTSAAVTLVAAPSNLLELPWTQILVGCLISLWGGLARTATRVLDSHHDGVRIVLWREVCKDLLAASLVGFITFGISAWQAWDVWLMAICLPLAGYGGARFLESLSAAAIDRLTTAVGGRNDKDKSP